MVTPVESDPNQTNSSLTPAASAQPSSPGRVGAAGARHGGPDGTVAAAARVVGVVAVGGGVGPQHEAGHPARAVVPDEVGGVKVVVGDVEHGIPRGAGGGQEVVAALGPGEVDAVVVGRPAVPRDGRRGPVVVDDAVEARGKRGRAERGAVDVEAHLGGVDAVGVAGEVELDVGQRLVALVAALVPDPVRRAGGEVLVGKAAAPDVGGLGGVEGRVGLHVEPEELRVDDGEAVVRGRPVQGRDLGGRVAVDVAQLVGAQLDAVVEEGLVVDHQDEAVVVAQRGVDVADLRRGRHGRLEVAVDAGAADPGEGRRQGEEGGARPQRGQARVEGHRGGEGASSGPVCVLRDSPLPCRVERGQTGAGGQREGRLEPFLLTSMVRLLEWVASHSFMLAPVPCGAGRKASRMGYGGGTRALVGPTHPGDQEDESPRTMPAGPEAREASDRPNRMRVSARMSDRAGPQAESRHRRTGRRFSTNARWRSDLRRPRLTLACVVALREPCATPGIAWLWTRVGRLPRMPRHVPSRSRSCQLATRARCTLDPSGLGRGADRVVVWCWSRRQPSEPSAPPLAPLPIVSSQIQLVA
ncbi:hypothetical protein VTK73DRAFT_4309 [Phialemonium thermophilum]|uniref:Uncharacterized protein n=1 Tax=Phialemonium thermophilum TaxID=223376 RepID=A0ABR3V9G8_9PEZI